MNLAVQEVLVGLLVAAGVVFSTWRLLSARLRLRLLDALRAVPGAGHAKWLASLRQRLLSHAPLACGSCSHVDEPRAPKPGASSRNQTPGAPRH